jgi:transcription-repair coupling factor (superfamily II helicase)
MTMDADFQQRFNIRDAEKARSFSGLYGSAQSYALAKLFRGSDKPLLVFVPSQKEALGLQEDLEFFLDSPQDVFVFPSLGVLPYYGLSPNPDAVARRMSFLYLLLNRRTPFIGILPLSALMRRLPPKQIFQDYTDYRVIGEEMDRETMLRKLVESGYQSVPVVEDAGTFSKRGGILDIFSPQSLRPVRLEFFGDHLESLRYFDPQTQRSGEETEDLIIIPAREIMFSETHFAKASLKFREKANEAGLGKAEREPFLEYLRNHMAPPAMDTYLPLFYSELETLFAYLPKNFLGVWIEPELTKSHCRDHLMEIQSAYEGCQSTERLIVPQDLYLNWDELESEMQKDCPWTFRLLGSGPEDFPIKTEGHEELSTRIRHAQLGEAMLEPLTERLRSWTQAGVHTLMTAGTRSQLLRLQDLLERHDWEAREVSSFQDFLSQSKEGKKAVYLMEGHLSHGFFWAEESLALITDHEIFGEKQRRQRATRRASEPFTSFEELNVGDYIVHEDHGLGIYRGLQALEVDGKSNDFILLEYVGKDKLYVPVYRLNLVNRYSAQEGHVPRLDRLGGASWETAKTRVRKALRAMAGSLLKLYAERATISGHAFSPGGVLYEEFEATFPFEETPDQLKAIQDVNRDMDEPKPMDRLICGDVGFGKTEVAMRATFRAILDNKQVAVLVPTTVLALQHERNFRSRFQQFPVVVEMLSRFVKPKRQKEVLEKLKMGKVDVVIGTHALLGKGVQFKDLGLLIVDEEHRFGVAQKEKIKKWKTQADVLTLTATPIPRTLNMSISGVRDLSVIATPPVDRMAIQTLVADYNESLMREAIHRELARGGQVYFIHNRVKTIDRVKKRLTELVPEAKIEMGHGQMKESELEEVMIRFLNREFNVFLCTAIVESGLDIPSANTMIIDRADMFGLAQLYQLRGRIGRANQRAYAYLLIPGQEAMTTNARARLAVLQRYTDLGSGFKIAAHDLEIRGAGNLLGAEQSGHIAAMGYDLYMKLMEEAVLAVKGEEKETAPEPELHLKLAASIPEAYIPETSMRLTLYKRFASVLDEVELDALTEETRDRFGKLPESVQHLITVMRIKIFAKRLWLRSVRMEKRQVVYTFTQQSPVDIEDLTGRIRKEPERFRWLAPHELAMGFKEGKEQAVIDSITRFLASLRVADKGKTSIH